MKSDAANQIRHGDHCDAFRKQTIKLCCDLPGPRLSVLIQWKKFRRKQREEEKNSKIIESENLSLEKAKQLRKKGIIYLRFMQQ